MAKLDLGYKTVELYIPGTMFEADIPGETHRSWEIIRTSVIWEQMNEPTQMLTISAIDEEGDNLDDTSITVNADMLDIKEL